MAAEQYASVSGLYLKALRACGAKRTGMWPAVDPNIMLVLAELGLVEVRTKPGVLRRQAWFLTRAGHNLLAIVDTGEPREP